jgi:enediyne biosynthesis protein E4
MRPSIPLATALLLAGCDGERPHQRPHRDSDSGTTTPVVEPSVDLVVVDGGEVRCADPSTRDLTKYVVTELRPEAPKKRWYWGVGAIVADLDQDQLLDLVLPGFWETIVYKGLPGGGFAEIPWSKVAPGEPPLTAAAGGTAADYDGDGDLDLFVTKYLGRNRLFRNDAGRLVDVSAEAGLSGEARRSLVSSWADLDHDGDLDLYVGCYGYIDESGDDPDHTTFLPAEPDWLYLNNGDGTFIDASDRLPQQVHDGYALAGGFHDLDLDGWLDLYVVNDFGGSFPNRLLWNRKGELVADDNAHGLDVAMTGMGVGVGDLNGDRIPDLVLTAWNGNHTLLSGAGGLGWFESVQLVGPQNDLTRAQKIAWGIELADMDNDGDLDAPMTYGYLDANYPASETQPDAMYLQGEDGVMVDVGKEWGTNQPGPNRGFVAVDLNDDGFLDLVKRDSNGPTLLYTSHCGSAAWLRISLRMPGANPFAVGARVVVRSGGLVQEQVVRAGGTNYASGGPPEVHFGLKDALQVDAVEVFWPDGEVGVVEDLPTRRRIELIRKE